VRPAVFTIASVVATCVVACGGDGGGAEPLTLEQRLVRESEVPGSEPDPVETPIAAGSLDDFMSSNAGAHMDSIKLEEAGFVSAVSATRFYPETPGGSHSRDAPHVRMLVIRFESDDGAEEGANLLRESALEPCPGTCSLRISEFGVEGVPDAGGVRRLLSAERLEETGEPGEPNDSYSIFFADGAFAYELEVFGPPGAFSETQIEEIAAKVHDRVQGAPAPGT
jgi:hypothetical protein